MSRVLGRPPKGNEKMPRISITLDADVLKWIEDNCGDRERSPFINETLKEKMMSTMESVVV